MVRTDRTVRTVQTVSDLARRTSLSPAEPDNINNRRYQYESFLVLL